MPVLRSGSDSRPIGIPLEIGIFITAADVFLILWLQNRGFRWVEAFVIALLG